MYARGWLFSPGLDFLCFGAPVLAALGIVSFVARGPGGLGAPLSPLLWFVSVVLVDVAHVYATAYRLYPAELRRRPVLYAGVPLCCYAASVLAYAASPLTFWRCMAYLAVVHFVRQQYGWVALAGRREGVGRLDRILDGAAVYAGTCYPLLYWHAHLPRRFHWFVSGDFARFIPPEVLHVATPLWAAIGVAWVLRQVQRGLRGQVGAARALIMTGTWATWYLGIVHWDSDVAFTVTNVLSHGVPYILVLHRFDGRRRGLPAGAWSLLLFCLPLFLLAYLEEATWDRLVWHDHPMLFPGPTVELGPWALLLLVPLLSLPQSAHYVLDAWIWRGGSNPDLRRYLK
jgi:hypothetical protein